MSGDSNGYRSSVRVDRVASHFNSVVNPQTKSKDCHNDYDSALGAKQKLEPNHEEENRYSFTTILPASSSYEYQSSPKTRRERLKIDIPKNMLCSKVFLENNSSLHLKLLLHNNLRYTNHEQLSNVTLIHFAASGLAVGEKVIFCPNCLLGMDFPKRRLNMLAAHMVYSPQCDLAYALYQTRKISLDSLGYAPTMKPSADASSRIPTGESPQMLVTRRIEDSRGMMAGESATDDRARLKQKYEDLLEKIETCEIEEVKRGDKTVKNPFSMIDERVRRLTFTEFGEADCPRVRLLAFRGLYLHNRYTNMEVRCAFCNLNRVFKREMITSAMTASSLDIDHINNNCGYISGTKDTGNIPDVWNDISYKYGKMSDASELLSASDSLNGMEQHAELGINVHLSKHPEMAVADRRTASFLTYPYRSTKHPDVLSEAGYFYLGDGDSVTCYSCGTISSKWTTQCDVWVRHVRTSPHCSHVLSVKGQNFVGDILQEFGRFIDPPVEDRISTVTTRMMRPRMDSISVQKALDMGIQREAVRSVVGKRIKKGKPDFKYVADIVREAEELKVPSDALENANQTIPELPKVLNQPVTIGDGMEESASTAESITHDTEEAENDAMEEMPSGTSNQTHEEPEDLATLSCRVRSQMTCKICMTDIVSIIFLPCGHLSCCSVCSAAMVNCPLCRKEVKGTVKVNY